MYNINMSGDLESDDSQIIVANDLDHLSVQLSINEEGDLAQFRCANCGEESDDQTGDPCDGSSKFQDCPEHIVDEDGDCESCDGSGEIEIHDWESIPLHWVNSAGIHARPDRDEIQVTISVGDPRGAFVMTVERHNGVLYLSVPHAGMGMSHMPLGERSPGWFKIVN